MMRRITVTALMQLVSVATILPFSLISTADATYNCVAENGGRTGCSSQDVSFDRVAGFEVFDSLADPPCNCNCGGDTGYDCPTTAEEATWVATNGHASVDCASVTTPISCWAPFGGGLQKIGVVFGACLGSDDNVQVAITVDLGVKNARWDVAMYINTIGGSALIDTTEGACEIVTMRNGTYGDITVSYDEAGADGDACADFAAGSGTLSDYAFAPITLRCADHYNPDSTTVGDNLLDFDVAIVWDNQGDSSNCDVENGILPLPSTNSK
jgi:hypothetical protein